MKKTIFSLLVIFLWNVGHGQTKMQNTKVKVKPNSEKHLSDRDSACVDPRFAIKVLMDGNKRFINGIPQKPRQDLISVKKLENGQHPFATIVGCSDSRVPNEMLFDQGFGDLFIIRTAGQVSEDASYASMEFAAVKLNTKLIVVLGHTECGAVSATVSGMANAPGHLQTLIDAIKPAVAKSKDAKGNPLNNAVRQNVIDEVTTLRNLDPILKKKYTDGELLIVGAVYDIHTGKVEFLNETIADLPKTK